MISVKPVPNDCVKVGDKMILEEFFQFYSPTEARMQATKRGYSLPENVKRRKSTSGKKLSS